MVTDAQVRLLRKRRMEGKTLEASAAAAAMSERTARTWQRGPLPSERQETPRAWRTREDPFEAVWSREVEPMLVADTDGKLEAKAIFRELATRHPAAFTPGQLRTLQRRVRAWRDEKGPPREVFFPQEHRPGRMASFDFTHATELGVTIDGERFEHLFFHVVLPYSGWHYVEIAYGETFEALVRGLQNALFALGGVPEIVRQDNLSAATHELKETRGRTLTKRFAAVLEHFGTLSSRIQPGEAHENGVVERGHRTLKGALRQALILRCDRNFATKAHYLDFVHAVVARDVQPGHEDKLAEERRHLRSLPACRVPEHTTTQVRVRKWSTIHVGGRIYSVPSRLIDRDVEARIFADVVEVRVAGKVVETMPRLRGERTHRIDYRHVIWSLVRKPGAFAAYRFREDLFPGLIFRRAYDRLRETRGARADVEYVRILHLAASTSEAGVARLLSTLLEAGEPFDYATLKALAMPASPEAPEVRIGEPNLAGYDALLCRAEGA